MQASDMMTSTVITVRPEATVGEAARRMLDYNISALPVVDEQGGLVGILTHSDFGLRTRYRPLAENVYNLLGSAATPQGLEDAAHRVSRKRVGDVMRRRVTTVDADATIAKVTETMLRHHIHSLPVMRDSRLVGIVTRHDFLKLIAPHS